jgi:alkanesulfonate monooxygenase SsuD/methylene tetrahydromethanopterin reductase-like flavin-dependent oxidoreductase (luciferase family)
MTSSRQIHLGAFMRPASIHTGAWRYPGAWPDMNFNFAHMKRCIQALERAKFDAFFMADHMAVLNMPIDALKRSHTATSFEPFTLLSALSQVTERIGLVATGSTTFDAPYHVARRFASLDHLSGGRAGLEHRHHLQPRCGAEFRHGRPDGARRALSPRPRVL